MQQEVTIEWKPTSARTMGCETTNCKKVDGK